jgi:NADH-quinone oxidoreductase subunit A
MYLEYFYIYSFLVFLSIVGLLLFLLSFLFVYQNPNASKVTPYECGFNPYSDARNKFEIKYYLIGILFIIFDLELIYLFPWILSLEFLKLTGIYSMLIFLLILTLGFVYE